MDGSNNPETPKPADAGGQKALIRDQHIRTIGDRLDRDAKVRALIGTTHTWDDKFLQERDREPTKIAKSENLALPESIQALKERATKIRLWVLYQGEKADWVKEYDATRERVAWEKSKYCIAADKERSPEGGKFGDGSVGHFVEVSAFESDYNVDFSLEFDDSYELNIDYKYKEGGKVKSTYRSGKSPINEKMTQPECEIAISYMDDFVAQQIKE